MMYASGTNKINDLTLPTLNMYGSRCALYKYESKIHSPITEETITVHDKKITATSSAQDASTVF